MDIDYIYKQCRSLDETNLDELDWKKTVAAGAMSAALLAGVPSTARAGVLQDLDNVYKKAKQVYDVGQEISYKTGDVINKGKTIGKVGGAVTKEMQKIHGVDMNAVKQIESAGNPNAYNKGTEARGLYQITPVVLKEWNQNHSQEQYTKEDLFDANVNTKIARWYMERLGSRYFKHFKIPVTVDNLLIAYNWGIGNLKDYISGDKTELPNETRDYIAKYHRLVG